MSLSLFDPIDANTKLSMDELAVQLRERLPWLWTPGFGVARIEGYQPGVFGARAGTFDASVYNVLHEVAHAIELVGSEPTMWKRRLGQPNFGMRIKSYQTVMGERYHEPKTMQATERECRVGAIQLHLLQAGGYVHVSFTKKYVEVLKYMADSYFGGDCILNSHDPKKYTDGEKEWVRIRTKLLKDAYAQYTPSRVQEVWGEVAKHLAKKGFELEYGQTEVLRPQP